MSFGVAMAKEPCFESKGIQRFQIIIEYAQDIKEIRLYRGKELIRSQVINSN